MVYFTFYFVVLNSATTKAQLDDGHKEILKNLSTKLDNVIEKLNEHSKRVGESRQKASNTEHMNAQINSNNLLVN